MNKNNSNVKMNENDVRLTRKYIIQQVYIWGVLNHKIPLFDNDNDEIKHYGKPISKFTKKERLDYNDAMSMLEQHFEVKTIVIKDKTMVYKNEGIEVTNK